MSNNKITGLPKATANGDAVDFEFFYKYTPRGTRTSNIQFLFSNIGLFGIG